MVISQGEGMVCFGGEIETHLDEVVGEVGESTATEPRDDTASKGADGVERDVVKLSG